MRFLHLIRKNFTAENTNIFNNHIDALMGAVVLVLLPAASLVLAMSVDIFGFWNYAFPLISISFAAIYDTYGRYYPKAPRNVKLVVRLIINAISILFVILSLCIGCKVLIWLSPIFLLLSGLLLIREIFSRVKFALWLR